MEDITNNLPSENTFSKEEFDTFVKEALSQIEKINESYKKLFEAPEEGRESIISEIEANLNDIKQKYEYLFSTNEAGLSRVAELNTKLEEIKTYHKELFEGNESIKSDIKESQDKITEFYVYLFGSSEGAEGEEQKIRKLIEEIINFHTDITKEEGFEAKVKKAYSNINELHEDLFSEVEGGKSKQSILVSSIEEINQFNEKIKKDFSPFLKDTKTDIETKRGEINSLLSNATVKTLAQGYLESMQQHGFTGLKSIQFAKDQKQKEVFSILLANWLGSFFKWFSNSLINIINYSLFILPLFLIGAIFIEPKFVLNFLEIDSLGATNLIGIQYILYKISVSLPLLWVSWYGQKNISHRKRLFEEYNHKLRVVQMYLLFISKDNSYQMSPAKMTELEDILLDVIKRNPSEVYGQDETMLDKFIELAKAKKGIVDDVVAKVKNPLT